MPIQVLTRGRFNRSHTPDEPLDDPNPDYDGIEGRLPVSPNPVPPGYPTPYTTGLRGVGIDPADLTPHAGGVTYSTPGQVIEGIDFAESVQLNAANITIRRCRITSSDFFPLNATVNATGAVIEDCRLRSVGSNPARVVLLEGNGSTMRRCDISGGADHVGLGADDLTIEDCYMAGAYFVLADDSHNDCIQSAGGANFTLRRSTVIGTWREQTSACIFKTDNTNISGLLLENNYFSGGNNTIYFRDTGGFAVTGVVMRFNRIELDSWNPAGGGPFDEGNAAGRTEIGTMIVASP